MSVAFNREAGRSFGWPARVSEVSNRAALEAALVLAQPQGELEGASGPARARDSPTSCEAPKR